MLVILCLIHEQNSISLQANKQFHPRAIKGREVGVGTQSYCITSSSVDSLMQPFLCRIFRQLDDTNKKCCISEHFLPTSHHVIIVSLSRLNWTHVWNNFRKKKTEQAYVTDQIWFHVNFFLTKVDSQFPLYTIPNSWIIIRARIQRKYLEST